MHLPRGLVLSLILLLTACTQPPAPAAIAPPLASLPPISGTAWPVPTSTTSAAASASPPTTTPTVTPTPVALPTASATPTRTPAPTAVPTPASCAIHTLAAMSEEQKIGQLFMIGLTGDALTPEIRSAIGAYHIGSVLFARRSSAGVAGLRLVADRVQEQASLAATNGVRFFVAANQEGGQVQALSGPGFSTIPSALDQGRMAPSALQAAATRWAAELRAAGVNLDLAPVADVVPPGTDQQNAPIGTYQREYAHDPASAGGPLSAFVTGMTANGVATTAKHFPGLGRVAGNTDFTADVIDAVTTRDDPYLAPFAAAIRAGVPFAMISEATYQRIDPAHLAVFSDTVINGMLRGDLGFRGVVISDSLGSTAVASMPPADRAIDFLDAGGDMIVLNQLDQAIEMLQAVNAMAQEHDWFRDRIENAAWHVLRAKEAAGLLSCGQ